MNPRLAILTLILPALLALVLLISVHPAGALADSACGPLLVGVPAPVQERLRNLDHEEWATRDEAGRWLVRHRELWCARMPADWRPASPEARWRWRGVLDQVALLEDLPQRLTRDPLPELRGSVLALARDLGGDEVARSLAPALSARAERIRERALRLVAEVDAEHLREHLGGCVDDPSAWVRRALYQVALQRDPEWARRLLTRAIDRARSRPGDREVVECVRRLRDRELLGRLRERWWADADAELRAALCRAWRGVPGLIDREVIDWQLGSGDYPQILMALEAIDSGERALPVALTVHLGSEYQEVRTRVRRLLTGRGSRALAGALLPELECDEPGRVEFAARCLVQWGAEDYYGDVAVALEEAPGVARVVRLVVHEGDVRLVPASARTGDGECSKSGESQPPPSGD